MSFAIRMGVPEMECLWNDLQAKHLVGTASKAEERLYAKWGKAMRLLSENPCHPSLRTHDIEALTKRYGQKVWQSYLENRNSGAMRMWWVYGPDEGSITVIALDRHPESGKRGAYDRLGLSDLPPLRRPGDVRPPDGEGRS
ncbi:conserved hypothetical protein [Olsenella uli DSM 7084]|uniref:Uncharacterized protein n=1 Tax=Olsenella uli (strain ATCC 49627 / DSM 7084 / CCUG 31166 / CIP 109912 / JCM 12494 / LMG 11480 / NCIMB 702895 / VPI D76D-27C) TaxID=633147 RepID=E1QVZ6_OLSUV|nr:hypothetical protein [Olsenella uli]ADK68299.1 conserved hypothetical protein [Olsenella uli DSM 7084]KRO12895.1 hypothetical protein IV77_GL000338 [Olsenella uli DSM 7084]